MSCENCVCPKCRRDAVARLVWLVGQVRAARALDVSQSSISRHVNRKIELSADVRALAGAIVAMPRDVREKFTNDRSKPGNG